MSWDRMVRIRVGTRCILGRDMIALGRAARDLQIEQTVLDPVAGAIISRITSFSAARPIGMAMPSSRRERSMRSRCGSSSACGMPTDDIGDFIDAVAQLQRAVLDMHPGLAVRQVAAVDIGDAARGRARG